MSFTVNKKIIGPAIFGIASLILLVACYWWGRQYLLNLKSQQALSNLINLNSGTNSSALPKFSGNLTSGLLQEVASQVKATPTPDGLEASLPDSNFIDHLSDKVVNSFSLSDIKPEVPVSSLQVINSNSPSVLKTYFNSLSTLLKSDFSSRLESDPSISTALQSSVDQYQALIDKLYALPVPSTAVIYHQEEIALLTAKLRILEKTIDYQTDPVATLLAIQADAAIDNQLNDLSVAITNFLNMQNISLN